MDVDIMFNVRKICFRIWSLSEEYEVYEIGLLL